MMNWPGGIGTAGWVVMAVLCVALIAALVWAIAAFVGRSDSASRVTSAVGPEKISSADSQTARSTSRATPRCARSAARQPRHQEL